MARKKKNRRKKASNASSELIAASSDSAPVVTGGDAAPAAVPEIAARHYQDITTEVPTFFVWGFAIFLAATAIVAPYGQGPYGYNPDLYMAIFLQVGAMFALFIYLFTIFRRKRNEILIPNSFLVLPLLLFYLWMVISLIWAHNFYEGMVKVLDWGAGILVFILTLIIARNKRALFPIIFCLFVSCFLISLLGVGQYLYSVDWVPQHVSPAATFGNKNMNGEYLITTIVLGMCLFIRSRYATASWLYGIATAFGIASVFYGRTRGSWLSIFIESVILFGVLIYLKFGLHYQFSWNVKKAVALVGSFLVLAVLLNATPNSLSKGLVSMVDSVTSSIDAEANLGEDTASAGFSETVEKTLDVGATKRQRFAMWANSYEMFKDHWLLGTGIGNWMIYYPLYQEAATLDPELRHGTLFHINAHNDYVEFICELGTVGLLLMLWIAIAAFRSMIMVFSKDGLHSDSQYNLLVLAAIVSILGLASNAFFSFPFQQPVTIAIVMAYAGILAAASHFTVEQSARTFYRIALPSFAVRLSAPVIAGVLTVMLLVLHNKWYDNDIHYFKAMGNNAAGKYRTAFQAAQIAYKEFPIRTRILFYIANYYYRNKQYDKTVEVFEKMRQDYPYRTEVLSSLAGAYTQLGKDKEFNELVEVWLSAQPSSLTAHFIQAIHAINRNDLDKAIEVLERGQQLSKEFGISGPDKGKIDVLLARLQQRKAALSTTPSATASPPIQ